MKTFDLAVIGWGKAGKTLAKKAAVKGKRVAMIERDPSRYGGTCINIACLPTKAMVHAASLHAHTTPQDTPWEEHEKAYEQAQQHRADFVARLNNKNYHLLADEENVEAFDGQARFVAPHSLEVTTAEGVEVIEAEHIVINTGAESRTLPIPGGTPSAHVHTSTTLLSVQRLPKRLGIVGAGFIGLEFASYFANFGTQVTVFAPSHELLKREDEDVRTAIKEALEAQGIEFKLGVSVKEIKEASDHATLVFDVEENGQSDQTIDFDQILLAVGRVPLTGELNLEAAGIKVDDSGAVVVDEYLETTASGVFAVGDVKGGAQFTFVSLDDSRIVAPKLGLAHTQNHTTESRPSYATCAFLQPPLAQVGLSEEDAKKQGIEVKVHKLPTAGIPKAHVIGQTQGLSKVLVDDQGLIVGATLLHPEAHEMINLITLAINEKIPASHLASMIYTHPTFTESLNDLLA